MKRPPPHLGLHHVALHTTNMEKSRHFWIDLLGYAVEWEPDPDNVYLTVGLDNVALHSGKEPTGPQRLDHVGLIVASAEDVFSWEAHLKDAHRGHPRTRPLFLGLGSGAEGQSRKRAQP